MLPFRAWIGVAPCGCAFEIKQAPTCAALGHPTGSISEGAGGPGRVVVGPPAVLDLSRRPPQHCGYVIAQCCGPGFTDSQRTLTTAIETGAIITCAAHEHRPSGTSRFQPPSTRHHPVIVEAVTSPHGVDVSQGSSRTPCGPV